MIKKFKEYIGESKKFVDKSIMEILPPYEVEDQFLRLKEVFNCQIFYTDELFNNVESVPNKSGDLRWPGQNYDNYTSDGGFGGGGGPETGGQELKQVICAKIFFKDTNVETILEELCDIKRRLESAYPVKMHTNSLCKDVNKNSGEINYRCESFIEPRRITKKDNTQIGK